MRKLTNRNGFTMMEMLIVVGIISVLTSTSVPTFTGTVDRARAATDASNVRAAKAAAMTEYLFSDMTKPTVYYFDGHKATTEFPSGVHYGQSKGQLPNPDKKINIDDYAEGEPKDSLVAVTVNLNGDMEATWTKAAISPSDFGSTGGGTTPRPPITNIPDIDINLPVDPDEGKKDDPVITPPSDPVNPSETPKVYPAVDSYLTWPNNSYQGRFQFPSETNVIKYNGKYYITFLNNSGWYDNPPEWNNSFESFVEGNRYTPGVGDTSQKKPAIIPLPSEDEIITQTTAYTKEGILPGGTLWLLGDKYYVLQYDCLSGQYNQHLPPSHGPWKEITGLTPSTKEKRTGPRILGPVLFYWLCRNLLLEYSLKLWRKCVMLEKILGYGEKPWLLSVYLM